MVEYPIASATGQGVPPSVSHERRHILLYRGRLGIRTSIAAAGSARAGGPGGGAGAKVRQDLVDPVAVVEFDTVDD